jgi:hypothetical protein
MVLIEVVGDSDNLLKMIAHTAGTMIGSPLLLLFIFEKSPFFEEDGTHFIDTISSI